MAVTVQWIGIVANKEELQSLDQITELPGVAADEDFFQELEAKRGFFAALRYIYIYHPVVPHTHANIDRF